MKRHIALLLALLPLLGCSDGKMTIESQEHQKRIVRFNSRRADQELIPALSRHVHLYDNHGSLAHDRYRFQVDLSKEQQGLRFDKTLWFQQSEGGLIAIMGGDDGDAMPFVTGLTTNDQAMVEEELVKVAIEFMNY